jgi:transposase-like protein
VRYLAIYLDGLVEQGHHVISVLGLTADGQKRVLGLREGSSESSEVCAELLRDLLKRGLDVGEGFLAVIDGGKGLASALKEVFGKRVLIQRCRAHKLRNILEKVPEKDRTALACEIRRAWAADTKQAKRMLKLTAANFPAAAGSIEEGLVETLSCNELKLPHNCALTRFLVTTNPLESLYARHTDDSGRVCRWRNGDMLLRWAGTSLALAEPSFAVVGDKAALQAFKAALDKRFQAFNKAA